MRRDALVPISVISVALLLVPTLAAEETAHVPDACPVTQMWLVPAGAGEDGPSASKVPFVGVPAEWRGPDGKLRLRYQQLIAAEALPPAGLLTGVSLRLDPATEAKGEMAYAVEIRVGAGPFDPAALQPAFEANEVGPQLLVYDATVEIGPDPEIFIPFDLPVEHAPAMGGLLVDLRVRGASADEAVFAIDADHEAPVIGHVFSAGDELESEVGSGGLVMELETLSPEAAGSFDPWACLQSLELRRFAVWRLGSWLELARRAGAEGRFPLARLALRGYELDVRRLEARRRIDPATAELLRRLGTPVAGGVEGSASLLVALRDVGLRGRFGFFPLAVADSLRPFVGDDAGGEELLLQARRVDDTLGPIIDQFSGGNFEVDDDEWDAMLEELKKMVDEAEANGELDDEQQELYNDLLKLLEDPNIAIQLFDLILRILDDLRIDHEDLDELKKLKELLDLLRPKVSADGVVGSILDWWLHFLKSLIPSLDDEDLKSIELGTKGDCLEITIDVEDGEEVELRILELIDFDTETWYGTTSIFLDMIIKKDTTITICPDKDTKTTTIDFDPADGVDLDLDSSGWFVVDILEQQLGIPDLDKLCIDSITFDEDTMVFEGKSAGKDVRIEVNKDEVVIEVEGEDGETETMRYPLDLADND